MTIRTIGQTAVAPIATSVEELISLQTLDSGNTQARAARETRQLGRELRSEAQRQQIVEMRDAADREFIAGVISGVGAMVSGALTIGGGLHGLGSAAGGPVESDALQGDALTNAQSQYSTRIGHETSIIKSSGELARAGLDIASNVMKRDAADARARQTEQENVGDLAQDVIQEAGEDLSAAERVVERGLDGLRGLLESKRRSEEAATRA